MFANPFDSPSSIPAALSTLKNTLVCCVYGDNRDQQQNPHRQAGKQTDTEKKDRKKDVPCD